MAYLDEESSHPNELILAHSVNIHVTVLKFFFKYSLHVLVVLLAIYLISYGTSNLLKLSIKKIIIVCK